MPCWLRPLFALLLIPIFTSGADDAQEDPPLKALNDLQWKHRLILVREEGDRALAMLRQHEDDIAERHIVWFHLEAGKELTTNYAGEIHDDLREELDRYLGDTAQRAILIGKDGGIKSRDDTLDLVDYFRQIDSMPMRQREMRRQQQQQR